MIRLLDQAVTLGVLRPLDFQFASVVAAIDEPDIMLAAASLSAESGFGHVCLTLDQLQIPKLFSGRHPELAHAVWMAAGKPDIGLWEKRLMASDAVSDGSSPTPMVLQGQRLYLHRMWKNEGEVAVFIGSDYEYKKIDEAQLRVILDRLFGTTTNELNWQKIAVAVAITRRIAVISGSPGTGKTTTVAKLLTAFLQLYEYDRPRIQLAAPTGKAAARLTESLGSSRHSLTLTTTQKVLFPTEAITLHRLLGCTSNTLRTRYHRHNPLHVDLLVVDEASMVDLPMMARLISALPENARLILLGDRDQLSSVESGAVLGDICRFIEQGYSDMRAAELSRLTGCPLRGQFASKETIVCDRLCLLRKNYRFESKSGIGQLAIAVNTGDIVRARSVINGGFRDVEGCALETTTEYHSLLSMCVAGYRNFLTKANNGDDVTTVLAEFSCFQVLCALRIGLFGVTWLNHKIESALQDLGLIHRLYGPWYTGRPIIIERNDNVLGLYNGDLGIALKNSQGDLRIHFLLPCGSVKSVHPSRLPAHETAYAMTVHKAQGSEFDHVVLVLLNCFLPILTRELVYTGITRARTRLSLYATDSVLKKAISTPTCRRSGLVERLRKG